MDFEIDVTYIPKYKYYISFSYLLFITLKLNLACEAFFISNKLFIPVFLYVIDENVILEIKCILTEINKFYINFSQNAT